MHAIIKYIVMLIGAVWAYFSPIHPLIFILIVLILAGIVTDTHYQLKNNGGLRSIAIRWSIVKFCIYIGAVVLTYFCIEKLGLSDATGITIGRMIIYMAIYTECLEINKKLLELYPNFIFLKFTCYLLEVRFVNHFSFIKDFLKKEKIEE